MTANPRSLPAVSSLRCEIRASKRLGPILANIVGTCARDLAQSVEIESAQGGNTGIPVITLVLPVERMLEPNQAWCLACRVACFCPDARVSVLVTGMAQANAATTPVAVDAA